MFVLSFLCGVRAETTSTLYFPFVLVCSLECELGARRPVQFVWLWIWAIQPTSIVCSSLQTKYVHEGCGGDNRDDTLGSRVGEREVDEEVEEDRVLGGRSVGRSERATIIIPDTPPPRSSSLCVVAGVPFNINCVPHTRIVIV